MSLQNPTAPTAPPARLTGVISPLLTPFLEDGSMDYAGARNEVRWLKSRKIVSSVFARSGIGGMWTFSMEEAKRFIETVVDEAAGEIGVLANSSGIFDGEVKRRPDSQQYLEQSIELAAFSRDKGADAVVLVIPYPLTPRPETPLEDMVVEYFEAVARAVDHPIFIYHPPGIPKEFQATTSLMRRLVGLPQIAGIKVSTSDHRVFDPIAEGVKEAPHFALIAGAEYFFHEALKLGAAGVLGGGAVTHPEILHAMKWHWDRGQEERVAEIQIEATACEKMLAAMGSVSRSVMMLAIGRQGYPMGPYTRGRTVYDASTRRRLPKRMDVLVEIAETIIEKLNGPYREAVQAGRDMP